MHPWIKSSVIYHIFLDRFAGYKNGANASQPGFCGGNIRGVIEKLPNIQSLGADTIWISPFYKTSAYHAYHITDFDNPDSRFGTKDDIVKLIGECKKRKLRIIADIVPNHCSDQHKWFKEAIKNKKSQFRDWFYFTDKEEYLRFLGFSELPKLNLENEQVAGYMLRSLQSWAKLGFDGFRIDHVVGVPNKFLIQLNDVLKQINQDFVLIGEAWNDGMKYKYLKTLRLNGRYRLWEKGFKQIDIQNAYTGIIDGVLDFGWRDILINNINLLKKRKYTELDKKLSKYDNMVSKNILLPRFLDNHDTNRIMYICKNDKALFRDLLKILFSQETPKILYYGTEYGLSHNNPVSPEIGFSDLGARGLVPWGKKPEFGTLIAELAKGRNTKY